MACPASGEQRGADAGSTPARYVVSGAERPAEGELAAGPARCCARLPRYSMLRVSCRKRRARPRARDPARGFLGGGVAVHAVGCGRERRVDMAALVIGVPKE